MFAMASVDFSTHAVNPAAAGPAQAANSAASAQGDDGFSFDDLLDIVNPLQHIPVVSTLYRALSGDTIKTGPKIAGDALYGGLTGLASSVADTAFTKITGKSFGDTVLGWVEDAVMPADTAVASDAPATPLPASRVAPEAENLGDRIVNWFEHLFSPHHAAAPVTPPAAALPAPAPLVLPAPPATTAPTPLQPVVSNDAIVVPGQDALLMALSRNGIGQDMAIRAADAYRRSVNATSAAMLDAPPALHGSLN